MDKIIENVTLIKVRKEDGAQCYTWPNCGLNNVWLSGYNRASNVKVGDKGRLEYRATKSTGLFWFAKEEGK